MRRTPFLLFLCCLVRTTLLAQQPDPEPPVEKLAFVEVTAPKQVYFWQERILLRLRVGFDPDFFHSRALALFRQELDVPVQVEAPWLDALPGALGLGPGPREGADQPPRLSIAVNDREARVRRTEDETWDGRRYGVLEIEQALLPERTGVLTIPGPRLRFAYTTGFREGLLGGRSASDRREASISGNPLLLRIDPLPEQGRPAGFAGAVGRFSVRADASPRRLRVGESLRLALSVEGEGNLVSIPAPRPGPLEGFHLFGCIEEQGGPGRTFVYDLVPLSEGAAEVPGLAFAYFDPEAGYRICRTEPIALEVSPLPAGATLRFLPGEEGRRAIPGRNDLYGLKPLAPGRDASTAPSPALFGAVLLAPWLLAGALLAWLRGRERARRDPEGRAARGAAAAFRAALEVPEPDLEAALAAYLAARLRVRPAAVIGPGLAARLEASGAAPGPARRLEALLEALVAARYGGTLPELGLQSAQALVAEIEQAFLDRERRP